MNIHWRLIPNRLDSLFKDVLNPFWNNSSAQDKREALNFSYEENSSGNNGNLISGMIITSY